MELRILGPVEADAGDGPIALGGPKQRLVLSILALAYPEQVSAPRLVDALWGAAPPPTAAKTLHVFVARLRRALGPGVLVTRSGGYALELDEDAIDARRFERLLRVGIAELASGRAQAASATLAQALALWRGPVLDDLALEPFVAPHAARLESLRSDALEERLEAELALGHHADVATEAESLIAREPLRERPYGQLMRALYAQGRQADALEIFRRARRVLVEEVGLEPGPELRGLQERMLAQDPELVSSRPALAHPRGRRRQRAPVAIVLATGGIVAIALMLAAGADRAQLVSPRADSVVVIDAASGEIRGNVSVGSAPVAVTAGAGALWVASAAEQTLERVDPATQRVTGRIGLGALPSALAAGEGAIWVTSAVGENGTVARVEPASAGVLDTVTVRGPGEPDDFAPHTPSAVVAAYGRVWTNRGRSTIAHLPAGGGRVATLPLGPRHSADGLAAGAGSIWVASSADDHVLRIDPRRAKITARIPIAGHRGSRVAAPYGITYGHGAVWVADALSDAVSRVDPALNAVTHTIPVPRRPTRLAVARDAVWVLSAGADTVSRIDLDDLRVSRRVGVEEATGLAVAGDRVWVSTAGGGAPERGPATATAVRPVVSASCARPRGPAGADVLIASDLPTWLGGRRAPVVRDMRRAIVETLEGRGFEAGDHRVAYQSCDDSTRRESYSSPRRCAANARAIAGNPAMVGVIGPYHSSCATIAVPILNAAATGPVAIVSPSNTYPGLTRDGPSTAADEPDRFYPTRVRNYARTVGADDAQAAAIAAFAHGRGLRRLFVLDDAEGTGYAVTRYVAAAGRARGVEIVGASSWGRTPEAARALAERVRAASPDGVLLAGCFCTGGYEVLASLRKELPAGTTYLVSDAMAASQADFPRPHPALVGAYFVSAGEAAAAASEHGRSLVRAVARGRPAASVEAYAIEAAVATEVLLDAIARSDGSRAGVVNALTSTRLREGLRPGFALDAHGDPATPVFSVYEVSATEADHPDREIAGLRFVQRIQVGPHEVPAVTR